MAYLCNAARERCSAHGGGEGAERRALGLTAAVTAFQLLAAARKPILRLTTTNSAPELPLAPHQHWHLFLSHVWRTAQDSCNAIKRNLQLLLPGVSIFLDTDDIGGAVGDLEKHVDAAAVVNIFVSKGYFMSKNCLREAIQTVRRGKPLTLVFDPVWGAQGLSLWRAGRARPSSTRSHIAGRHGPYERGAYTPRGASEVQR